MCLCVWVHKRAMRLSRNKLQENAIQYTGESTHRVRSRYDRHTHTTAHTHINTHSYRTQRAAQQNGKRGERIAGTRDEPTKKNEKMKCRLCVIYMGFNVSTFMKQSVVVSERSCQTDNIRISNRTNKHKIGNLVSLRRSLDFFTLCLFLFGRSTCFGLRVHFEFRDHHNR